MCYFSESDILRGKSYFMWLARYPKTLYKLWMLQCSLIFFSCTDLGSKFIYLSWKSDFHTLGSTDDKEKKKKPRCFLYLYLLGGNINALGSTGADSWSVLAVPGDFPALWGVCALWLPCSGVVVALGQFSQSTWCLLCCLTHFQSLGVAQSVKEGAGMVPGMEKQSSSFHIDGL